MKSNLPNTWHIIGASEVLASITIVVVAIVAKVQLVVVKSTYSIKTSLSPPSGGLNPRILNEDGSARRSFAFFNSYRATIWSAVKGSPYAMDIGQLAAPPACFTVFLALDPLRTELHFLEDSLCINFPKEKGFQIVF